MKKYIFLVLLAVITSFSAFSQKNLKEFQMSYEITDIDMKGAQGAMVSKMMKGSTMTMFIKGSKNKIAMNMMQGMMRQETYMDSKTKNLNSFISMMGRKMEIMGMDSIYKYNLEKPDTAAQTEIVQKPTATGKKKEILGYQCEEFISKTKDKDKNIITYSMFVAKDLKAGLLDLFKKRKFIVFS